jgi:hypothetical protein
MASLRRVQILRTFALSIIALGVARAGTIATADGTISVTDTVTSIAGGLFQYDYNVVDGTGLLIDLDIAVPVGTTITNFFATGGVNTANSAFVAETSTFTSVDTLHELVSFTINDGSFATSAPGTTLIFDSSSGPGATTFNVTVADSSVGNQGFISGISGITGPAASGVPEPASAGLCALGGAVVVFLRKRLLASRS